MTRSDGKGEGDGYVELLATSNFSFLRGGSHPHELVAQARALGLSGLAIADRNTLAGIVRAHVAAREVGLRFIPGARLDLVDAPSLVCLPGDRAAYGRLSRLISLGQSRAGKGRCHLSLADVAAHAEGQVLIVIPPDDWDWRMVIGAGPDDLPRGRDCGPTRGGGERSRPATGAERGSLERSLAALAAVLCPAARLYLAACHGHAGEDRARIAALDRLGRRFSIPLVATGDVLYHAPHRRHLQDVLTAIRLHTTVAAAGFALAANAERHLKSPREIGRLFRGFEDAIARTREIMAACRFSLDELVYEYPDEQIPSGVTPQGHLELLTWEGAQARFPQGVPTAVDETLRKELALIARLDYARYFLTVHDIVGFARARGILCQGRGSAANSVVCYCLSITAVNPVEVDLLFERFISAERKEPPDIDVDFEHERREEVIQHIYARYGRDRAGLAATVITYRARSAVREVGRAMGLSADTVAALAGMVWGSHSGGTLPEAHVCEAGLDPRDPLLARVIALTEELIGFPRHLSQHVGGFVLTRGPLIEVVPVGNAAMAGRTFIEWDKDDIAALGLLKIDVLALGMLTCIRKAFALIEAHHGIAMNLAAVPRDDPAVYDMLCRADTIGVFQVESRAQMNMLPRLRPRTFYDLVIEVAIVRPGPIQGDMVHPYLRRRDGLEAEEYPSPSPSHGDKDELRNILAKTKGVPLFQEQAMRIAMIAARFTDGEVNELRKAMATFRRRGTIGLLEEKMIGAMVARGYAPAFAARCFNQIKGFGEYGFPESHAASFAHLVYVSAWLKCHYPAAFACALLNAQPMGFYAPAQIVRCAREHGVEVGEVDVNFSAWEATLEDRPPIGRLRGLGGGVSNPSSGPALRLGLSQIDGFAEEDGRRLVAARDGPIRVFTTPAELQERADLSLAMLERLAAADAMRTLGLDRREALWEVKGLSAAAPMPLFAWGQTHEGGVEAVVDLPRMAVSEHVVVDYQTLRLSLKAHPVQFLRPRLAAERALACADLRQTRSGAFVAVAGIVLVRQRPGSAKGVVFMTIEDETGIANAVIWPRALERFRKVIMGARLVLIRGRIQRHEDIIHVVVARIEDRSPWLADLATGQGILKPPIARADEVVRPEPGSARGSAGPPPRHPRQMRIIGSPAKPILPRSRDFH